MKKLQEENAAIQDKLKQVEAVSMVLQTNKLELQIQNSSLKRKLGANDEEIIQLMQQSKKQQQDIEAAKNSCECLKIETDKRKLDYERRIIELENRIEDQHKKNNEISNKSELEQKLSKLRSEKYVLMREKETQQKIFESDRGELEAKIRKLELSRSVLKAELRETRKRSRREVQDSVDVITSKMMKMGI